MFNIKQTVKGNTLIMEVDLTQTSGLSKSGKNTIIASTNGNAEVEGEPIRVLRRRLGLLVERVERVRRHDVLRQRAHAGIVHRHRRHPDHILGGRERGRHRMPAPCR